MAYSLKCEDIAVQVRPGAPVRLTREQVAHLPMQEFTALWKVRRPRNAGMCAR
jgi:hypothetical protein